MRLQKYECFILLLSLFTNTSSGLNSPLFPSLTTNSNGNTNSITVPRVSAGPISISAIGCGTWSWGNRLLFDYNPSQDEEIYAAYRIVRDGGVTLFDTADSYGTLDLNGRAEILLGEFERRYRMEKNGDENLEERNDEKPLFSSLFKSWDMGNKSPNNIDNVQQVATKFAPYPWRIRRSSMVDAAKASLKRLQQDRLAIAQLHWSTANYQPFQEKALWEGIADVYDQGYCDAIGVSNYGPQQFAKIADRMRERDVPICTAQIQYSLMTFKDCKDVTDIYSSSGDNCRIISYSPLCLGLLTGKYDLDNLPRSGPRKQLFKELLPGAKSLLNTLEVIAKDKSKTQSQVAINWAMSKGTVPIPGARTVQQAKENLGSVGWTLDSGMKDELERAALSIDKPMIQNVFQTK